MPYRRVKQLYDYKKTKPYNSDFQDFLLKEKQFQLNVMNNLNQTDSLHDSLKRSGGFGGSYLSENKSPHLFSNEKTMGKGRDSFNSESSGSLKYMSKNLNI
jgi:hypothetical protein